ncbi:MAG TPA: TIGR03435 family protein [Bryobacteraceae bacterium]
MRLDAFRAHPVTAAAAWALSIAGAAALAQQPAFEVASIKPDVSGQPGPLFSLFPGFTVERATLRSLVLMAYGIHDFQLSGGPGWINSDRYNIEAKAQPPATFSQEYRTLQNRRLQTLLQERFRLALHHETKELPIFELTVAKGGPNLQPTSCLQRDPGDRTIAPGKAMNDYCGFGGWSKSRYEATTGSMADLAGGLSGLLERIVVDKTGITGTYHIVLTFTPDDSTIRLPDLPGAPEQPPADGANIFTAIQEQLGLKLESAKGPVDVLVIDHAEKPSEN